MKYIKYFEGFTEEQLNYLVLKIKIKEIYD